MPGQQGPVGALPQLVLVGHLLQEDGVTGEGIKKGQTVGILMGRLLLTKKREKDTDHPCHCYLLEVLVNDRSTHLQVQGAAGFSGLPH